MNAAQAYAEVERITRRRARNFAYGIMVLPRPKRRAIAAIYAFARRVDDVADGAAPAEQKAAELDTLRTSLTSDASASSDPTLVALADARRRYAIPLASLDAVVAGAMQDLTVSRYGDFAELEDYCRKVAGAIGVACVAVYGSDDVASAETLGVGLQLVNIVRDVEEDLRLGRVYLPQDELAAFGVGETELARPHVSAERDALMSFQAERARRYVREGLRLLDSLDARSALCVSTFANLYLAMLDRVEAAGFAPGDRSVQLSRLEKLRIVGGGLRR